MPRKLSVYVFEILLGRLCQSSFFGTTIRFLHNKSTHMLTFYQGQVVDSL